MWQLMVLCSTGVARMAILFSATVTLTALYDFWHDFAGKGVLNVLGGVLPK